MKIITLISNDKGAVLITGLMFLLFLTIIGATALITTTNDVTISSNYKSIKESFYNAEAGVHLAVSGIENRLKANTLTLPALGSTVNLQDEIGSSIPSDYNIVLGSLQTTDGINYTFTSTGQSSTRGASTKINASFRKGSAFEFAAFGDDKLDANSAAGFYSYSSDDILPPDLPTNLDTTHDADIGSNGEVDLDWTIVDGDVKLGEKDGDVADQTYSGIQTIHGDDGELVGYVPDDPLDMRTIIPDLFATYTSSPSDNDNLLAGLLPGDFELNGGETLIGKTGGAHYYIEDIELGSGDELIIDASAGPVNIYLKGEAVLKNGAELTILNANDGHEVNLYVTEDPANPLADNQIIVDFRTDSDINMNNSVPSAFGIFSDSDAQFVFHHLSDFQGVVYSPDSLIDMKNSGNVYGSVWGNIVNLKSNAEIYYDTALLNKYLSKEVILTGWAQVLE